VHVSQVGLHFRWSESAPGRIRTCLTYPYDLRVYQAKRDVLPGGWLQYSVPVVGTRGHCLTLIRRKTGTGNDGQDT